MNIDDVNEIKYLHFARMLRSGMLDACWSLQMVADLEQRVGRSSLEVVATIGLPNG
jgi:hypothetical protein